MCEKGRSIVIFVQSNQYALLRIAHHPSFSHPLPIGHRFPMEKYELIPAQLIHKGTVQPTEIFAPELAAFETIALAHAPHYCSQLLDLSLPPTMVRRIGFPLSKQLVARELRIVQGTIDGCLYALQHGVAFNVAGGTHHAGYDWGEGFCLLNDQGVAAAWLISQRFSRRVLIIDLDVHQGNGTAQLFYGNTQVFTFSMHGERNFPFRKEQSDLDVGLPDGTDDDTYLALLTTHLEAIFRRVRPDFVLYQAGVDVLGTDKLGRLALSKSGCRKRDALVFQYCKSAGVPVQVSMGGGYSPQIRDIVDAHCQTFEEAIRIFD